VASALCRRCFNNNKTDSWYAAPAPAAVDLYLLPAGRSAANQPPAAAAVDLWDRRTDGQTADRYMDPAPHTKRASSLVDG